MDYKWWIRLLYLPLLLCELVKSWNEKNFLAVPPSEWNMKDYPNPQDSTSICNHPNRESWICDPNGILTNEEVLTLDDLLEDMRQTTKCTCDRCTNGRGEKQGYVISVALLNRMSTENYNNPESPEKYEILKEASLWSKYLRRRAWQLGACGNDAVLLLSAKDKVIYISTGEEICEILSDKKAKVELWNSRGYLSDRDYFLALKHIINNWNEILQSGPQTSYTFLTLGLTYDEAVDLGLMLIGPLSILDFIALAFFIQILCNVYVRGCKSHDVCYKLDYKNRRLLEGFKLFLFQPLGALVLLALVAAINFVAIVGTLWLLRKQNAVCGISSGSGIVWT